MLDNSPFSLKVHLIIYTINVSIISILTALLCVVVTAAYYRPELANKCEPYVFIMTVVYMLNILLLVYNGSILIKYFRKLTR